MVAPATGGHGAPTKVAEVEIPPIRLIAFGTIGGLIGIYLSGIPVVGPVIAGLGGVCAIFWGADAVRRVASYGLGTGVPSIGAMLGAVGLLSTIMGVSVPLLSKAIPSLLAPIAALIIALIIGAVSGIVGRVFIKMEIPIFVQCTTELAGASVLSVLAFSSAIAGSYLMTGSGLLNPTLLTGYMPALYFMCAMAIQHPFNACLGPNEDQYRTLKCALAAGFAMMAIVGILSIIKNPYWWLISLVAAVGWAISMKMFVKDVFENTIVQRTGWWPEEEQ
ncbi:tetrahydromethanopterin S-methyltransferase, subunit C [Methanothermus fervidus DSM 2088]|uniref:Tetrahydromethanopterin S-methyltransferase subunit C n=1 Tax=Methanothermus fervidus (strain ATCC 43054 / DSM 2088 / JCM 10308 / V24 S) TaxID=523846 RepID=E3GZ48_METFV|nr:tetrahydromethanopterin S-methyltransferase subunit C [Methanothermus fervidus]ADP77580.1 tetrahydromethanopterin S-methyltransferase, subunit C [Methanothermus fervidus DSM 2088]